MPFAMANTSCRNRSVEYDTYRDPIGPLSASAQVLFGAIANFVTGLADVPTEMVLDLVSAGRALSHPGQHPDYRAQCQYPPRSEWHVRRSDHDDELQSDDSTEERPPPQEQHTERSHDDSSEYIDDEQEEEEESSGEVDAQGYVPHFGLDGQRTLGIARTQTMSNEIPPVKRHGFFNEAANHGSKMSKKLVNLIIWLPTDISLSLSKGFHNAPKLYHDRTVKSTPKVIGFRSGVRAAGKVC